MTYEQWLQYAHRQGQKVARIKPAVRNIAALAQARFPYPDENKAFMEGYENDPRGPRQKGR